MIDRDYLSIYLNDHLAGSTGGLELAKRGRGSHEGTPVGELFARLVPELEAERDVLKSIIAELGFGEDRLKQVAGWSGEKAGRLKLNGHLISSSPLSVLTELEGIFIGVTGKLSMWRNVHAALGARLAEFDLPGLIAAAERQQTEIEELRITVAEELFGETAGADAG